MSHPTTAAPPDDEPVITIRVARTADDKRAILALRDSIYVQDQNRLVDVADMTSTFDRFDPYAVYLMALDGAEPIGCVKVVPDSPAGLPCEDTVDLARARNVGPIVEFGHLMTLPRVRHRSIGQRLMRSALVYSIREHGAAGVVGDFFIDDVGRLRAFYTMIGFEAVGEPYRDVRFKDAPLSVVAWLDLAAAARRVATATGKAAELLHYFFHDYDALVAARAAERNAV
jgi:putrescine aminotransferase